MQYPVALARGSCIIHKSEPVNTGGLIDQTTEVATILPHSVLTVA